MPPQEPQSGHWDSGSHPRSHLPKQVAQASNGPRQSNPPQNYYHPPGYFPGAEVGNRPVQWKVVQAGVTLAPEPTWVQNAIESAMFWETK